LKLIQFSFIIAYTCTIIEERRFLLHGNGALEMEQLPEKRIQNISICREEAIKLHLQWSTLQAAVL